MANYYQDNSNNRPPQKRGLKIAVIVLCVLSAAAIIGAVAAFVIPRLENKGSNAASDAAQGATPDSPNEAEEPIPASYMIDNVEVIAKPTPAPCCSTASALTWTSIPSRITT